MKPYTLEFQIAGLPKMSNQLLRGHWRVKHGHAKRWKQITARAVYLNGRIPPHPLASAVLLLTRASSTEPDYDGLVSGFKNVIDSLVEIGVIASDKSSCIKSTYVWEKVPPRKGHIRVRVQEISTSDSDRNELAP